jgi:hypothetical protein
MDDYADDDDDDDMMFTKAKYDMKDIKTKVEEMFDTSKDLEFYDGKNWKPLKDLNAISKYKGGKEPLKVRVPEHYDEETLDEEEDYDNDDRYGRGGNKKKNQFDDDDDDYNPDEDDDVLDDEDMYGQMRNTKASVMEDTINELVSDLKEEGYERSDIKPYTMKLLSNGHEVSTKDWVLKQADKNPTYESVLLGHVGALEHIVQCLHYDMVWKTTDETNIDNIDDEKNNDNNDDPTKKKE